MIEFGRSFGEPNYEGTVAATKCAGLGGEPSLAFSTANYSRVLKGIRSVTGAPIIGCSASAGFTDEKSGNDCVVVGALQTDEMKLYPGISKRLKDDATEAVTVSATSAPSQMKGYPYKSMIMLIDGLAGKGEAATVPLILGGDSGVAGGASADKLEFKYAPLWKDENIATDTVVSVLFNLCNRIQAWTHLLGKSEKLQRQ
jgi:FIST N domain.